MENRHNKDLFNKAQNLEDSIKTMTSQLKFYQKEKKYSFYLFFIYQINIPHFWKNSKEKVEELTKELAKASAASSQRPFWKALGASSQNCTKACPLA